jgi:hypothetical protein
MDVLTAEEKLASWVENVTGMTSLVFRTGLPRGIREGMEVKLLSGTPGTFDKLNEYTFEIKGLSPDRKSLMERFNALCALLPLQQYDSFVYAAPKGAIRFNLDSKEGMQLFTASMELTASFA